MNRRDLLSSVVLAALNADAQEPSSAAPSLYIPNAHRVEDLKLLQDFMDEFAFVELVTSSPFRITHIPVLFDRTAGQFGTIHGHIARANEQIKAFDGKQEAVIVFRGPHGYISPTCYQTNPAVPTWNFAVVHATGKLQAVTDPVALHAFLARLIRKFETYEGTGYDFSRISASYLNPMLANIVGFDMRVELLEGKFKLGQERPEGDRQGILKYLQTARRERSLHDLTENFYKQKI
ncbi:MAG TPA: FMN-binding negative transcriptional regulator [Bryobacteraceae bacterium]|nr:FMN-binding negative transcriptional regulator [Bryobacteraceae bacterium]